MTGPHTNGARRQERVTIVLPAKNEENALGDTLDALPLETLHAMGLDTEVFVLDGNSHDATAKIARDWGATVVTDREPGKAAALRNARELFRGDYVVMLDADGTYAPDAIPAVVAPLMRGEADVMMGHRLIQRGSMKGTHLVGNVVLSMLATALFRRYCPDVCTGLWGFRAEVLRALPLRSEGFGLEAELYSLVTRMGYRMEKLRVDYLPRAGRPKLDFGTDGLQIVRTLMKARFEPLEEYRDAAEDDDPSKPHVASREVHG